MVAGARCTGVPVDEVCAARSNAGTVGAMRSRPDIPPEPAARRSAADAVMSRAQARAAGIRDDELRRHHSRTLRGQWKLGGPPAMPDFWLAALNAAPPGAFLSHHTAARFLGAVAPVSGDVHLGLVGDRRVRVSGLFLHRYVRAPHVINVNGLPVTAPAQTFIDLASCLGLVDLVVLGDSFAMRRPKLVPEFARHAAETRCRGVTTARRAAALVRAGAESPQETRLRLMICLSGLPEPELQLSLRDDTGSERYRLDLAYRKYRVAIEYDGRAHIDRQRQWELDIRRREAIESEGWRFVVATSHDIFVDPAGFLTRLRAVLRDVGMPVAARPDAGWLPYFLS